MAMLLTLLIFPSLMIYSAWSDLLTMTLSNWISILLVASFLMLSTLFGVSLQEVLIDHVFCFAVVLILTFFLFAQGWIGGGDAKIAAATAMWVGWNQLEDYGVITSLIGGALTVLILAFRRCPLPNFLRGYEWISRLHCVGNGVPYGIALSIAGLIIYPETVMWASIK